MITTVITQKLIAAQKSKDELGVSVLRFLNAAIKNKEIELRPKGEVLDDEKIFAVLKKQIKMRNDSIESYKAGNRADLVEKESKEKDYLENLIKELYPNHTA